MAETFSKQRHPLKKVGQGFFQAFIATTVFSFELSFHAKAEGL